MKLSREFLQHHRDEILAIARRYGADDIRVFGSVARGDAGDASDLDIVVRFQPERSLFDHGGLLMELRELLGVKVDVVDEQGMRDRFRDRVMKEAIPL